MTCLRRKTFEKSERLVWVVKNENTLWKILNAWCRFVVTDMWIMRWKYVIMFVPFSKASNYSESIVAIDDPSAFVLPTGETKWKKKPSSWHYSVGVYKMQLMHIILYANARAFNTALRPSKHTACYWYQLSNTTYAFWMIYNKETFGHSGLLPWCRWFIEGCINVLISRQSRTRAETDRPRFGRFDKNTILFPFDCNVIKYYKPSCEINFQTLLENRRRIRCILLNEYKASRSALVWFCFYFF